VEISPPLPAPSAMMGRLPRRLPLMAALMAPLLLGAAGLIAFELANSARIYPGVRVAGVDVSGVTTADAVARLAKVQAALTTTRVTLRAPGRSWIVRGADVGLRYDLTSQVSAAYRLGRRGPMLDRLGSQATLMLRPRDLLPLVSFDHARLSALVTGLAGQLDRGAQDAQLGVVSSGVTLLRSASAGQRLDQAAAAAALSAALVHVGSPALTLPILAINPRLTTAAARSRATAINNALVGAERGRATAAALRQVQARRAGAVAAHNALRLMRLSALVAGKRTRQLATDADSARLTRSLGQVTAAGRAYTLPTALLRAAAPALLPRPTPDLAAVRRLVATIATRTDRQARSAQLVLRKRHLTLIPSHESTTLERDAALRQIVGTLSGSGAGLALTPSHQQPAVRTADLLPALARGQWLLAHPPTLVVGAVRWTPPSRALANALRLGPDASHALVLDPGALRRAAAWLASRVRRPARNASFGADGQKAWVIPSADGVDLDAPGLAHALLTAAPGTSRVTVPLRPLIPRLTTARARALGIKTMVGMSYTNFYGSSGDRITNILTAVRVLDGSLIPPGAVFSFNKSVGEIDYKEGYVDELTILDGKDVPGVGGGVCQVAVTIFKAALYAGLPIVERTPHANVVSYYQPTGMDATIYNAPGGPDVKFKNDTGRWLLLKFAYNLNTAYLEARFYSTDIHQSTTIYGPYYSYPGNGDTTAIFYRKVYRQGKLIRDENFFSHYVPVKQ